MKVPIFSVFSLLLIASIYGKDIDLQEDYAPPSVLSGAKVTSVNKGLPPKPLRLPALVHTASESGSASGSASKTSSSSLVLNRLSSTKKLVNEGDAEDGVLAFDNAENENYVAPSASLGFQRALGHNAPPSSVKKVPFAAQSVDPSKIKKFFQDDAENDFDIVSRGGSFVPGGSNSQGNNGKISWTKAAFNPKTKVAKAESHLPPLGSSKKLVGEDEDESEDDVLGFDNAGEEDYIKPSASISNTQKKTSPPTVSSTKKQSRLIDDIEDQVVSGEEDYIKPSASNNIPGKTPASSWSARATTIKDNDAATTKIPAPQTGISAQPIRKLVEDDEDEFGDADFDFDSADEMDYVAPAAVTSAPSTKSAQTKSVATWLNLPVTRSINKFFKSCSSDAPAKCSTITLTSLITQAELNTCIRKCKK